MDFPAVTLSHRPRQREDELLIVAAQATENGGKYLVYRAGDLGCRPDISGDMRDNYRECRKALCLVQSTGTGVAHNVRTRNYLQRIFMTHHWRGLLTAYIGTYSPIQPTPQGKFNVQQQAMGWVYGERKRAVIINGQFLGQFQTVAAVRWLFAHGILNEPGKRDDISHGSAFVVILQTPSNGTPGRRIGGHIKTRSWLFLSGIRTFNVSFVISSLVRHVRSGGRARGIMIHTPQAQRIRSAMNKKHDGTLQGSFHRYWARNGGFALLMQCRHLMSSREDRFNQNPESQC
ncbi:hypothetical protein ACRALDRAFT_1095054 [Sodiomyces alcalophilus JCM 7366]|uniref:uncharacterized protein n=1 Tax=Sodiomyces alcalophilus JCM 7366 TaxID=591952 RepID=UPI0039B3BF4F